MKDSLNFKNKENFSIEVRKNNSIIEKIENAKKYLFKNDDKHEVEYSYALYKEN